MADGGVIKHKRVKEDLLVAAITDEDTCTGLLLGGIGDKDKHQRNNFLVCSAG
jgi:vacuolar-type H+-ATPase subunit F/Vma7